MSSLYSLLSEIAEAGWLVSNLFQLNSGIWQANLRSASHHTGWGRGSTPELALSSAMDLIAEAMETTQPEPTCGVTNEAPPLNLGSLLRHSTFNLRVKL